MILEHTTSDASGRIHVGVKRIKDVPNVDFDAALRENKPNACEEVLFVGGDVWLNVSELHYERMRCKSNGFNQRIKGVSE